eukprot:m.83487 g.83487  ORF g.83487 m.83487 type:complete len:70 (+) comp12122_c1_seq1:2275-2484(+)
MRADPFPSQTHNDTIVVLLFCAFIYSYLFNNNCFELLFFSICAAVANIYVIVSVETDTPINGNNYCLKH